MSNNRLQTIFRSTSAPVPAPTHAPAHQPAAVLAPNRLPLKQRVAAALARVESVTPVPVASAGAPAGHVSLSATQASELDELLATIEHRAAPAAGHLNVSARTSSPIQGQAEYEEWQRLRASCGDNQGEARRYAQANDRAIRAYSATLGVIGAPKRPMTPAAQAGATHFHRWKELKAAGATSEARNYSMAHHHEIKAYAAVRALMDAWLLDRQ